MFASEESEKIIPDVRDSPVFLLCSKKFLF